MRETDEVRELLVETGCRLAQGFLFGRALPADELSAWLATREAARR